MRSRQLGKRQLERAQLAFETAVTAELAAQRAIFDGTFHHLLPTRAGLLLARPISSVTGPGGFVALRFDDVEAGKVFLQRSGHTWGLNPYSGKWNLNLYGEEFGEGCEDAIRSALRDKLTPVLFTETLSADEWTRRLEAAIQVRKERLAKMFPTEGGGVT